MTLPTHFLAPAVFCRDGCAACERVALSLSFLLPCRSLLSLSWPWALGSLCRIKEMRGKSLALCLAVESYLTAVVSPWEWTPPCVLFAESSYHERMLNFVEFRYLFIINWCDCMIFFFIFTLLIWWVWLTGNVYKHTHTHMLASINFFSVKDLKISAFCCMVIFENFLLWL